MASRIDLHTHTPASAATLDPAALLAKAHDVAIQVLGIADHDSTAGYEAVLPLASQFPNVTLIPSIEINAEGASACHLLGYFFDFQNAEFQKALERYRTLRQARARAMVDKLNALGIALSYGDVQRFSTGASIGRPHIADALIEKKVVRTRQEAFDRFLKKDGSA